jgi:hypothetical protein
MVAIFCGPPAEDGDPERRINREATGPTCGIGSGSGEKEILAVSEPAANVPDALNPEGGASSRRKGTFAESIACENPHTVKNTKNSTKRRVLIQRPH